MSSLPQWQTWPGRSLTYHAGSTAGYDHWLLCFSNRSLCTSWHNEWSLEGKEPPDLFYDDFSVPCNWDMLGGQPKGMTIALFENPLRSLWPTIHRVVSCVWHCALNSKTHGLGAALSIHAGHLHFKLFCLFLSSSQNSRFSHDFPQKVHFSDFRRYSGFIFVLFCLSI